MGDRCHLIHARVILKSRRSRLKPTITRLHQRICEVVNCQKVWELQVTYYENISTGTWGQFLKDTYRCKLFLAQNLENQIRISSTKLPVPLKQVFRRPVRRFADKGNWSISCRNLDSNDANLLINYYFPPLRLSNRRITYILNMIEKIGFFYIEPFLHVIPIPTNFNHVEV